jgi:hypothetical protein
MHAQRKRDRPERDDWLIMADRVEAKGAMNTRCRDANAQACVKIYFHEVFGMKTAYLLVCRGFPALPWFRELS